jgi:iron complex transport system substrate-binding protein
MEDKERSMLASVQGNAINVEGVLNLSPDLVLTDRVSRSEIYESAGIPVLVINLDNYENFQKSMLIIGEALGETEFAKAKSYNAYCNSNINFVSDRLKDLEESDKQSVYYMYNGFEEAPWATVGKGEIQEAWIKISGGIFATEDLEGRVEDGINPEYLLTLNPDIIILGHTGQADMYDELTKSATFSLLSAVKNDSIVRNPFGILAWCRTSPEYALQIVWAAKTLHQTLFADINMHEMTKSFYLQFYGIEMSDENITKILQGKTSSLDD